MQRGPPALLTTILINTPDIELWPGGLLRARSNHDARALARASRVLRRKRDGAYLAAELPEGLLPLIPRLRREPGLDAALDTLDGLPSHARNGLKTTHVCVKPVPQPLLSPNSPVRSCCWKKLCSCLALVTNRFLPAPRRYQKHHAARKRWSRLS